MTFDPSSVTSATKQLWLRSDVGVKNGSGVAPSDGDGVQSWSDQFSLAPDYIAASAGVRPVWHSTGTTHTFNTLPGITFDGISQYLHCTNSFNFIPLTLFIVYRLNSVPGSGVRAFFSTDEPSNGGQSFGHDGTGKLQVEVKNSSSAFVTSSYTIPTATPTLSVVNWNGTQGSTGYLSASANNCQIIYNGVNTYTVGTLASSSGSDLGTYDASASFCCACDIAEVVLYSATLSGADFDSLMAYFAARYGDLPGTLGSPYKVGIFNGNGSALESLRILSSSGGVAFDEYLTYYKPSFGTVRDPSLLYYLGKWWVAHTNVTLFGSPATSTTFEVASSVNAHGWDTVTNVDCSAITGIQDPWGPKWFRDSDGSIHIIICCSTQPPANDAGFAMYELHPTNAAMTTWSTPVQITGDATLPNNIIDAFMFRQPGDSHYYILYKNENTKYLELLQSASMLSGYTAIKTGDWALWGSQWEGCSLIFKPGGGYRVYADDYNNNHGGGMHYSDGTGASVQAATWTAFASVSVNSPGYSGTRNGVFSTVPAFNPAFAGGGRILGVGIY